MIVTLRRLVGGHVTILSVLGLLAVASLVAITTAILRDGARTVGAAAGVRAASEIEIAVLLHENARELARLTGGAGHDGAAGRAAIRMQTWLAEAQRHVDSPAEQLVLDRLGREIRDYLAADAGPPGRPLPDATGAALATAAIVTAETLVNINVTDADASFEQSRRLAHAAVGIGMGLAALLAASIALVIGSIRQWLYRPLTAIQGALERFRGGDRAVRLPGEGPLELRAIGAEFNRMADALAGERAARSSLLAALAHDLRNPLNALRLTVHRVGRNRASTDGGPAADALALVRRQVDRLARLADDLVDMARIEAGRLDLRLTETDVREVAKECVTLYRLATDSHQLVMMAPETPVVARCDPDRLAQVLNNLISNAIKYSPEGSEVWVRVDRDRGDIVIAVADTGPGLDALDAERLFTPFERLAADRTQIPGEGLGLWIAHGILQAHGGSIRVRTTPGNGATFEVRLPAAAALASPALGNC